MRKQVANKSNPQCYCGEQFNDYQRETIRKTVCRDNSIEYKDNKGNLYCIFHFPNEKKKDKFDLEFHRMIEKEDYQFYGTWFPSEIDFSNHKFNTWAGFTWATFNYDISFENAQFLSNCEFLCSTFKKKVSFSEAQFLTREGYLLPTNFHSATLESVADFGNAIFKNEADFSESKFLVGYSFNNDKNFLNFVLQSSFSNAIFQEEANFEKVSFGNPQQKEVYDSFFFNGTRFEKIADFQKADFFLQTNFSKAIFKKTADFRETQVKTSLNFEEASFEGFAKFSGKDAQHSSWSLGGLNFQRLKLKNQREFFSNSTIKTRLFYKY
jgi:hypothetical protein